MPRIERLRHKTAHRQTEQVTACNRQFIESARDVVGEIEEVERARHIIAAAIAAKIEGDAAPGVGQVRKLGRPVGPVSADAVQEHQGLALVRAFARNIDGEAGRKRGATVGDGVHGFKRCMGGTSRGSIGRRNIHNLWLSPPPVRLAMNSATLDYFLAAYRHRSIGKACRELGLSQPALSKTIRRLEDELRVQLFERTPVGIEPTSYGHTLARRANIISNEIGRAASEIATLRGHIGGEARIGVGPALASSLVSEALAAFLRERPRDGDPSVGRLV